MSLVIMYAVLVIVLVFAQVRTASRRARHTWQVNVTFGIIAAYIILTMILWLRILEIVNMRASVWVATLFALIVGAILVGLLPPEEGSDTQRRRGFWKLASAIRRPFYDFDAARKQYTRGGDQ